MGNFIRLTVTITRLADSSLAGGENTRWQRRLGAIVPMLAGPPPERVL
jgi:hypothetical protein